MKLVPPNDMLAWLKREDCPAPFVELMLQKNWPLVSEAAKRHVSLVGDCGNDEIVELLTRELKLVPCGKESDQDLLSAAGLVPPFLRSAWGLSDNPIRASPPERTSIVSMALSESECQDIRKRLRFSNPQQLNSWVKNPELGVTILRFLTFEVPEYLSFFIWRLLENPALPVDCIEHLFLQYRDGRGARLLIEHPDTSQEFYALAAATVCSYSGTSGATIILGIANAPLENRQFQGLARAVNWHRRLGVALNPLTPPDLLALLSHDGNRLVSAAAKAQLETPGVRLLDQL